MRMNAVLSNPKHPEYGQFTVPLPIPHNQYDGIMEALNAMDMGDPLARDCQMDEILGEYPILKRLEGKPVNIDELDYAWRSDTRAGRPICKWYDCLSLLWTMESLPLRGAGRK